MRRSRLLLAGLPAYGMLALPLSSLALDASWGGAPDLFAAKSALFSALFLSNLVVNFFMFAISDGIRPHWSVVHASYVALNLAFWLPLAYLAGRLLERRRPP